MIKLTKIGPVLLATVIFASTFAGCGKSNTPQSTAGTATNTPKEIADISLLVYDRGQMPSSEGTLEDNWFTKELNKRTQEKIGVRVKFVPVPNAQREQKLATLLAASEAPDICYTYDQTMLQNYTRNGGLTDLGPLVDKYGADIKKTIGSSRLESSKIDGKLTRVFSAANLSADYTWIRTDWLDKLGMKMPTNVDEFYAYLKALKAQDPGKVGDKLVPFMIPASGDTPFLRVENSILQGFLKEPPTQEKIAGVPFQLWPETKDTFKFLNKLYNEKLMGELVIDKDQSQYKQMLIKGQIGATLNFSHYMYNPQYGNLLENLQKNVPGSNMVGIFPWKDPASKETIYEMFLNGPSNALTFFVPKATKNPDAAVKFLNYMASDDYITLLCSGIENTDYTVVDVINTPVDQDKFKTRVAWLWGAYNALAPLYVTDTDKYKKNQSLSYNKEFRADFIKYAVFGDAATKYASPVINLPTPVTDKNKKNLDTKWNNSTAKFIMSPVGDFDKTYDDALKTWKAEGGDDMAKEQMDAYKKQYGK
jgi:putative aldouronate transport system substrate-binding protein